MTRTNNCVDCHKEIMTDAGVGRLPQRCETCRAHHLRKKFGEYNEAYRQKKDAKKKIVLP